MLDDITPLILTFNEEPNIRRTLSKLHWARHIVVVDSMSTDATTAILRSDPRVKLFQRPFDSHAAQWNFGLTQTGIASEWVLALDADYVLSDELIEKLRRLEPGTVDGYKTSFTYCVFGKPLRATVYPPVVTLFRRSAARYEQDGHTQRLQLNGSVASLDAVIHHDDRKPLSRWLASQDRYMKLEAEKLCNTPHESLAPADRLRQLVFVAPVAMLFYCLFWKRGILDGLPGAYYAMQRTLAEVILSLHLIERRIASR